MDTPEWVTSSDTLTDTGFTRNHTNKPYCSHSFLRSGSHAEFGASVTPIVNPNAEKAGRYTAPGRRSPR
jgi:hypothetical protein